MEAKPVAIAQELRHAVRDLRARGLKNATKFASELLLGMPWRIRQQIPPPLVDTVSSNDEDMDLYEAAKASFDMGEYRRAYHMLSASQGSGHQTFFLRHYAWFLAGEKAKEETELSTSITAANGTSKDQLQANTTRQSTNPHLKELYLTLGRAYEAQTLDAFGKYLFAIVLRRLGYATTKGNMAINDQENKATITMRHVLIESIRAYPWNWSAWMELAAASPFISEEEHQVLSQSSSYMFTLFQAHVQLEQQQNDAARQLLDQMAAIFPQSTYLLAQQALTSYHMRDFDQAQDQFEALATQDPYRVETMDVFSNVLYVKEDKTELSRLAHRASMVEKYCPETCCIIGNYYSLKNKHDRAIVYFHRALKLDPNFLSAWTLIGHEYVEMKNTSAAIEAYRHAVDLNARDYRAWYGLGQAYEILNMYLYSIYYYRKAASIRPYDARMWCALGGCYEKLQKMDEAIVCFQRAVGNQDREGIASYHLGRIYASQSSKQHDAATYYQLHLGIPPSWPQHDAHQSLNIRIDTPQALGAILFLANYYKQLGRFEEATLFCNRLLDLQGPEKEEAKALLREMRSLDATKARKSHS